MTKQLKGKIHWVLDDFFYIGMVIPKKDQTAHIVARLNNVIIDEHMIKFYVEPYEVYGELWSYNVNLLINDNGTRYIGTYAEAIEGDWTGEVNCELFSNSKRHLLYGKWIEEDYLYTFWAIIERD